MAKRKLLRVSPEVIGALFTAGVKHYEVIRDGVPKDARVVEIDSSGYTINLLLESEGFPDVESPTDLVPIMETRKSAAR